AVLKSTTEQGKLTPELEQQIQAVETMALLEDIYLPFKPKRKTRASVSRERGLQPLAARLLLRAWVDVSLLAADFIDSETGVTSEEEALAGARDIIAEQTAEDAEGRARSRKIFLDKGLFVSRVVPGKEEDALKYKDYFDWSEPLQDA